MLRSSIRLVFALTVAFSLGAGTASACTLDGREGFIPDGDLRFDPEQRGPFNDVTQAQFDSAVEKARKVYAPVFAAKGLRLEIVADWADATVNAYASLRGDVAEVRMFGGFARHPKMTLDGFSLVICHEIGHHLAGVPKTMTGNIAGYGIPRWMANEGQSDYFAATKCAREIWGDEDNAAIVEKTEVSPFVTERCQKAFDSTAEISLCKRSAMAGFALTSAMNELASRGSIVTWKKTVRSLNFDTPDPTVAKHTQSSHPDAQCRLDTYFAGAVCAESKDVAFNGVDPTVGACAQEKGAVLGARPLCWYTLYDPNRKSSKWPQVGREGIPNPSGSRQGS